MNVGTLLNFAVPNYAAPLRRARPAPGSSAFAESLTVEQEKSVDRFIQGPGFSLRMGKNILCSGGVGGANAQTYEAEFTADSTDEDPVVRIRGRANSGAFDYACHIRDIDPSNASYAELAALNRWLCRTGAYQTEFSSQAGDAEAMEQILRYCGGYINKLCTRKLVDAGGYPHEYLDST